VGLAVAIAVAACADPAEPDRIAACRLGADPGGATARAIQGVAVQDRKAVGLAAEYSPDLGLAAREDELERSQVARRAAAWEAVRRALEPVPLAAPELAGALGGQPAIPAWHTWYGRDDFERVWKRQYRALAPADRRARAPIDVAAGLAWNAIALDGDPAWPEARYLEYLAAVDTADEARGLGGISRVGYSPAALGHLAASYAQLHRCRLDPEPPAYSAAPAHPGRRVVERVGIEVGACEWRALDPILAGDGAVRVGARGPGADAVDVLVRRGAAPTPDAYDCRARGGTRDRPCEVAGGGPIYVAALGEAAAAVEVELDYVAADVAAPTCLSREMPRAAALVKAEWQRAFPGDGIAAYDTSAGALAAQLAAGAEWAPAAVADPSPESIYTVQLPSGARFRMPALHLMTKELDHWLWITLWWSPAPDTDFGADRPRAIAELPGPWRHYKMCAVTSYVEQDRDPRGGAAGTLGDALAATYRGAGGPSWCSSPYLEQGAGNAATNCIGCHQHGGTALRAEQILGGPARGSTRARNNFFTDYLWAVRGGAGDDLSALVQAEIDYWDAAAP
jgi:hypothetical protein